MQIMPSDFALKTMNAVHRALLSVTLGKVGWRASGMPVLELTTIGRKETHTRNARIATSEERAEMWPRITVDHANYGGYQEKTDREIPLILLETVPLTK